ERVVVTCATIGRDDLLPAFPGHGSLLCVCDPAWSPARGSRRGQPISVATRRVAPASRRSGPQPAADREPCRQGCEHDADPDEDGHDQERVLNGDPRRDERDAARKILLHPELHSQHHRGAGEHRADHGGEHALQDERGLDEPVRGADEAHDPDLPTSGVSGQTDGRADQQDRGDEHEHRDAHRDVGGDRQRGEERIEVLELVFDLLDTLHTLERLFDHVRPGLVLEVDPEHGVGLIGGDEVGVVATEELDRLLVRLVLRLELQIGDERFEGRPLELLPDGVDLVLARHAVDAALVRRDGGAHVDRDLRSVLPERAHRPDLRLHEDRGTDEGEGDEGDEDDGDDHRCVAAEAGEGLGEDESDPHDVG
ncbi:hypothetical protein ABE10_02095, partial [Bacillus toyonensis]|nr:hypothetical protein [Bacillus toyonensis]